MEFFSDISLSDLFFGFAFLFPLLKLIQKLSVTLLRRTNCPESEPARHPVLSVTKLLPRL